MKNNPFFSLIIPVYNVEKYLSNCLNSILSQDFTDFELILVNDGSNDGSGDIITIYQQDYPHIILFEQENKGQGAARNLGVLKATGKYIWFIDSDDHIAPNSLQFLYEQLNNESNIDGIAFTSTILEIPNEANMRVESKFSGFDETIEEATYRGNDMLKLLLNGKLMPMCWNKVFSKTYFEKTGFRFTDIFFEDIFFNAKMIASSNALKYVRKDLYIYNQRSGSTMFSKCTKKHVTSIFAALHDVKSFLIEVGLYKTYKSDFCGFYWRHLTFIYITIIKDSNISMNSLFLDVLAKSTESLDEDYYLPSETTGDFPFALLLKLMMQNENIDEEIENKMIECFNFSQEFIETYM